VNKRIAYYERWVAPIATEVFAAHREVELLRLDRATVRDNWGMLARAHGYQALTRPESNAVPGATQWLPGANLLERAPQLLAVCVAGSGYDVVDVEACTRAGVIVCNQAGSGRESVAEHSLGFMLALSKKIALADHVIRRRGGWTQLDFQGNDLIGKTLGIVGFGQIGTRLAEMCKAALSMEILAFDPHLTTGQIAERGGVKMELDELLARSDFVSLNMPLIRETRGMMGRAQFARMKPGAFFLTTARGGVHDEEALCDALASGHLGGAGIDVFDVEPPPPDHRLFSFDNVVATPHTAGITVEAAHSIAEATAQQWLAIFRGEVPPRLLNPESWDKYRGRFERAFGFTPSRLS
jgi:D-3-phosphoglycerate dehydrogenase